MLLLGWMFGIKLFGKILGILWLINGAILVTVCIVHFLTSKTNITRHDAYGTYIVDRTKYPGRNADWQYNHYRFEIKTDGQFVFYQTENEKVVNKWEGTVDFHPSYTCPRLMINVDSPSHHIIDPYPTLYITSWSFYYVFHSPLYGNVFFTKGKWKPIND